MILVAQMSEINKIGSNININFHYFFVLRKL